MSVKKYWELVDPVWDAINIYDGPEVFLRSYGEAPRNPGLLFAAHFCQSEVCNGGFAQLFSNSTGVLAPEASEGFRVIGQHEVANTLDAAMRELGPNYTRDRKERQELLGALPERYFRELERRFFALIGTEAGGFVAAADEFACRSKS